MVLDARQRQIRGQQVPNARTAAATPGGLAGLQLFARYAYPPNVLGYCGPDDHRALFDYGTTGTTDRGLVELAAGFPGPWPYLTLMAGTLGISNPFDVRLVEAYWVGNQLLDRIDTADFGHMVEEYFLPRAGRRRFGMLAETIPAGALAHHSFHVLGVYPWVGLLRTGRTDEPLHHLDRCRIRWGQVEALRGDQVDVTYQPLAFDGTRLQLGPWEHETVERSVAGTGFVQELAVGDWVSMHWHWICDRLDRRQLANLRRYHQHHLDMVNDRVDHSGPGLAMAGDGA